MTILVIFNKTDLHLFIKIILFYEGTYMSTNCLGVRKDNVLRLQEDCTDVSAGRGTQDNSATLEVLLSFHNHSKNIL